MNTKELDPNHWIQWCPGCGNFGILPSLKNAIVKLGINPKDIVIVSGIGCSSKFPHYVKTYGFESIHGRGLPAASGIKLSNPNLTVIAVGGDGDGYGIGLNHFIQSVRRNINITYLVHNNLIYGLTKGQTSPTSEKGFKSKSTPHGVIEYPINPLTLALSANGTFISRGYAGNPEHLTGLIVEAIKHKGFSLVDIFQPCISWNKINSYEFFNNRLYNLNDNAEYNIQDKNRAFVKAQEWGEKIPYGIFYFEQRSTYGDELPQNKDTPVCKQPIDNVNVEEIIDSYK
jgi:2-oxoglutarate/2-oxoacid ferredoxin oxidoreductase subunit beta